MEMIKKTKGIDRLLNIMARLRAQDGCKWDRQQSPKTLKLFILEEAYELLDAIDSNSPTDIRDEMGDLLLQIVFLSQIFTERELFNFNDVATAISDKMIRRHPHVFGSERDINQHQRWEEIKSQERSEQGKTSLLRNRIPLTLPALKTSAKIIKANHPSTQDSIYAELHEALDRLCKHTPDESPDRPLAQSIAETFYSLAKLANINQLDPEDILRQFNNRQIALIDHTTESKT